MIGERGNGIAGRVDVLAMPVQEREDERVEVDGFLRASDPMSGNQLSCLGRHTPCGRMSISPSVSLSASGMSSSSMLGSSSCLMTIFILRKSILPSA